ncbi:MAG: 4-hydroxy-3-methylbut-2-enyl diphosphate reductase [Erysipelotrichaceae bacterium]|nr:4-hydroxy-3-methylbut-2-enyl diphosphate reductase [Erysipelotrichaceae bacterium]
MEIRKVVPSGYCKGVVNAIRLAKKTREENPDEKIYVLGMLVHNSYVSKELADLGIVTLDDTYASKSDLLDQIDEGIVIFTAHGIADAIKEKALAKGFRYVDATCVDVLKTQNIIKEYLDRNYDVIYFGKKRHPEAEAVLAISDRIHLVADEEDLNDLQIANDKIFLTNQTTMSYLELSDLMKAAKAKYPKIVMEGEICNATSSRQLAVSDLEDCDLLYVVGDVKSNNTGKLVDIGRKKGIRKVFLIQSYKDISHEDLKDVNKIYVTAGTSTPPKLIDEVISYLSSQSADQLTD